MTKADRILRSLDGFDSARFWTKVQVRKDGHWAWKGARNAGGYGMFSCGGQMLRASRVAFTLAYGRPPQGVILHSCDRPHCVRPQCLSDGTQRENMADARAKGRPLGTRKRVLSPGQVVSIRLYLSQGKESQAAVARRFGISPSLVSQIKLGKVHAK